MHTNPSTEKSRNVKETHLKEISKIITDSSLAQSEWGKTDIKGRVKFIHPLIKIFKKEEEVIARTIALDMGKPLTQSRNEVKRTIRTLEYFCKKTPKLIRREKHSRYERTVYGPKGIIAVISPWNYPFETPLNSVIPALICGNSVILKPSEHCPSTGRLIQNFFDKLDIPKNIVSTIFGGKKQGECLTKQRVDMISFTGSTHTGKKIIRQSLDNIPKLLLELGGLDPAIVLKDVSVESVARKIVALNSMNSGQVCCSIKRVYVESEIYDSFVENSVKESKKLSLGNPLENVDMGPLVSRSQLKKIENMLQKAKNKGAKILAGGNRLNRKGLFFPHTVLTKVDNGMLLMNEEPFGPILPIVKVENWKEAVHLSNNSRYGLTASVWTKNRKLGKKICQMLEAGIVSVNTHGSGALASPWGGIKQSGTGLLSFKELVRSFTEPKLIRS